MKMLKKHDYLCFCVIGLILIGIILEIIGGLLSKTNEIGFNTNLSPLVIVGLILVAVGFIAHFPIKILSKMQKAEISSFFLDLEVVIMIIAVFVAVLYVAAVITFPVIFPANG